MDTYEIGSLIRNANAGLNSAARLLDSAENRGVKDEVEDGIKEVRRAKGQNRSGYH